MSRRKQANRKPRRRQSARTNKADFREVVNWAVPSDEMFAKDRFHGNTRWRPQQLIVQALIWAWQAAKNVTDAFEQACEVCSELGADATAKTYPAFMQSLVRHRAVFDRCLRAHYQERAESIASRFWRDGEWVPLAFDGSRVTGPRSVANEQAFCAPNYGKGKTAKYRKKKSQGMRRKKNERNKPQPQAPQVWITMLWHMKLRLPWTWRLGPSNASERVHVMEMLKQERFPEKTLFCGDAGFVGYPLWDAILSAGADFLVRVGANVSLLSETVDFERRSEGIVLCWPKHQMDHGGSPLRLLRVTVGKTKMWMLTSILDPRALSAKRIIRLYKQRWGVEVEFRGLKQTNDKSNLRCRNNERLLVELTWSLWGMAIAELLALRAQIPPGAVQHRDRSAYAPTDRSLANTMRTLRTAMRKLHKPVDAQGDLLQQLSQAVVGKYNNSTHKQARYRPKNPDKRPLGDPVVKPMTAEEREKLRNRAQALAA